MTKKGFFVPAGLALAALLITGIPLFAYGEEFLSLPWWPVVLIVSFVLTVAAIVTDLIYAPAPKGYMVFWDQKRMDIRLDCRTPVVLKRMTVDHRWAKVEFLVTDMGLIVKDHYDGNFATVDINDKEGDGLVQFPSGSFMVSQLTNHFRVTWSRGAWVEDKKEQS